MQRLLILTVLVLAGCASTGPPLTVAAMTDPPPDPASLLGWWRVEGTRQVVLIDPAGLEILDPDLTVGGGLTLTGTWRADPDGRLIARVDTVFGPAFDVAPGAMPEVAADYEPDWLTATAGFRADGPRRELLDDQGRPVARLVPEPPAAGSGEVDPARVPTETQRRGFGPAAPVPAGLAPLGQTDLIGRWVPEGVSTASYVEFAAGGTWAGSDGCNGTGGAWLAGSGGAFLATTGRFSTRIACEGMVDVGGWVAAARRVALDGAVLVLLDVDGATVGRMAPAG